MKQPTFLRPESVTEALALLKKWGESARILSGGTDLLIQIRRGSINPETMIDISLLDELKGISLQEGKVVLGALTTYHQICSSVEMREWAPVLVAACQEVGSPQIRSRASIGGNLGNASPAGDTIPPLYVLEAEVQLMSQDGSRWIGIEDFFSGPGKTIRKPNELISRIRFSPVGVDTHSFFNKIGQRKALTIAKVSASGLLALEGNLVKECRLALGAVAPTVIRLGEAEELLAAAALTEDVVDQAAALAGDLCSPISDIRSNISYRRHLAKVLVKRGLGSILQELES